jgi:hypothetical protein
MEAIWRRLNDVNRKLPEEIVFLIALMGLYQFFGPKEEFWNLERTFPWRFSRKTCYKKL